MSNVESPLQLAGSFYDAAVRPDRWPKALARVAETLGATTAAIFSFDAWSKSVRVTGWGQRNDHFARTYNENTWDIDIWNQRMKKFPQGTCALSQALVSSKILVETEFYDRYLRPHDILYGLCAVILKEGPRTAILRLHRPARAKPFGGRELTCIRSMLPHVERAIRIHQRLCFLELQRHATVRTLDQLPIGVIYVDASARVHALNRSALEILDLGDGLIVDRHRLAAALGHETERLRKLIGDAAKKGGRQSFDGTAAMTISRPSMEGRFPVLVSPLSADCAVNGLWDNGDFLVAVFVCDSRRLPQLRGDVVARLFDLTPAEARLVLALVRGTRLEDAADEFHVSLNTVRTQLKQIFLKTDVNRQAELVKLVLNSPAAVLVLGGGKTH